MNRRSRPEGSILTSDSLAAYTHLHAKLTEARNSVGLSQRDVARILDVPQTFVSRSERGPNHGGRHIEAVELPFFAALYKTTVDALLEPLSDEKRSKLDYRRERQLAHTGKLSWARKALVRKRRPSSWAPLGWSPPAPPSEFLERRDALSEMISTGRYYGLIEAIRESPQLLEMSGFNGERPLFEAARKAMVESVRAFVDLGADPDIAQEWTSAYAWAQTARDAASKCDDKEKRASMLAMMGGRSVDPTRKCPWAPPLQRELNLFESLEDGLHQQIDALERFQFFARAGTYGTFGR